MTREEILKQYDVSEDGTITSPGKFQGEMLYMPLFWNAFVEGLTTTNSHGYLVCEITKEDREEFPELKGRRAIVFDETDQGFVCEIQQIRRI